jgi:glutamyl-Q tRNA(Asp) synthetase
MNPKPVTGRFAPSPTGDLHFGSLVSAVGSYLEAKAHGGAWLIRIEDLDPPREVKGSAMRIISDLTRLGMEPDQPVLYQSTRHDAYTAAINQLLDDGRAFPCACSRRDIPDSGIYPGTCRKGIPPNRAPRSIRFRSDNSVNSFVDSLQGEVMGEVDDFVIKRADGYFAYQLAVVVDDEYQQITEVVRGADLIDSTTRQIALQQALGFSTPRYMHLPIARSVDGKKLSKRHASDPVGNMGASEVIDRALRFLGQNPPQNLSLTGLWAWALEHWDRYQIPRKQHYPAN